MPPLARRMVDTAATAVLTEWIQSLPPGTSALPSPWSHSDIGQVGQPGDAGYVNGQFNLVATGGDIWLQSDAFHLAYRAWEGDGMIIARVVSLQPTDPWAKAGVMFRETASADSKYAAMLMTPANGAFFQERPSTGGASDNRQGPVGSMPCWFRLVRNGDFFTGWLSNDGAHWTEISRARIPMAKRVVVGLALTAHNNALANSALFDQIMVAPAPDSDGAGH